MKPKLIPILLFSILALLLQTIGTTAHSLPPRTPPDVLISDDPRLASSENRLAAARDLSGLAAISFSPSSGAAHSNSLTLVWQIETVDSTGDVGEYPSLGLDSSGYPHISYHDITNTALKYAYQDASGWHLDTADSGSDVGKHTSVDLDSSGYAHISYYDYNYNLLKHVYQDASGWHIYPPEMVDEGGGEYTSIALDGSGYPHISYYDNTNGNLKYAYQDSYGFHTQNAHSSTAYVGWYTSLALDTNDYPHISYYDASNGNLMYAYYDGSYWQTETVDDAGNVGVETSLVLDGSGYPHISYWDWDNGDLKYAYYDGAYWHIETVDSAGDVGRYSSLALDSLGYPHISYVNFDNGAIKYAYQDASGWQIDTVTDSSQVGVDTSLALDADDNPHISYYDYNNGNLKYAAGDWASGPPSDIPLELQRRATELLEELRGSGMAPEWDDSAEIGTPIRPIYRPDVTGIAYYEFPVMINGSENSGFIILSTDQHDYSIAHWSSSSEPPTQQLEQIALDNSEIATQFYKLDALAYAAENDTGEMVATLGDLPPKITGLDPTWLDNPPDDTEAVWRPGDISGTVVITGPVAPASLQFSDWDSWEDLKTGYDDTYGVLLETLQEDASQDWETEDNINQQGVVLFKGDVYKMALLGDHGTAYFAGPGVDYVNYEIIQRTDLTPLLQITALDSSPGESLALTVTVEYTNEVTEEKRFLIVGPGNSIFLPLVTRGSSNTAGYHSQNITRTQDDCPYGYTCAWAGDQWDQRWYSQMPPWYWDQNWNQCYSGCGATAWAMLFGWADHQAELSHPYWWPHWGIYRQDGGYGNNADAPSLVDDGVRSMTSKIRGYINTWCDPWSTNAATFPGDMVNAYKYLIGRANVRVSTHYNYAATLGLGSVESHAINSIVYRQTPAIVGLGFLNHYALAYGYAERPRTTCTIFGWPCWTTYQRQFKVNQGWTQQWESGGTTYYIPFMEWVSTNTWFVGEIYP